LNFNSGARSRRLGIRRTTMLVHLISAHRRNPAAAKKHCLVRFDP